MIGAVKDSVGMNRAMNQAMRAQMCTSRSPGTRHAYHRRAAKAKKNGDYKIERAPFSSNQHDPPIRCDIRVVSLPDGDFRPKTVCDTTENVSFFDLATRAECLGHPQHA
jgi:hypothetical protein